MCLFGAVGFNVSDAKIKEKIIYEAHFAEQRR